MYSSKTVSAIARHPPLIDRHTVISSPTTPLKFSLISRFLSISACLFFGSHRPRPHLCVFVDAFEMESLASLPAAYPLVPLPWHAGPTHFSDDNAYLQLNQKPATLSTIRTQQPLPAPKLAEEPSMKPSRENCDRRRPGEDASRLPNISQQSMSQSVTPFLREHIPSLYAPIGKPDLPSMVSLKNKDPNSKYCYRHRPDSKCRRAADESKMALIQRVSWCRPVPIALITT